MTLVRASTALDARVEEYRERPVLSVQFLHLVVSNLLPVVDQLAREPQRLLEFFLGDKRLAVRHHALMDVRDDRIFLHFRCFEISHVLLQGLPLRRLFFEFSRPRRDMP